MTMARRFRNINAQGGLYGNALRATSLRGNLEIIQLLLDKGADVNAEGGKYGNALQAASHRGNLEIVQLLLAKGADVNAGISVDTETLRRRRDVFAWQA
ncbi:uncharacterized protein FTOL_13379 [Fusarium torulosum]|uniref:Ankyrin n=1 Tax=Fusarium torulosum TaxID=33205 RepID=A0AAE8SPV2_9HYPO|nr:uncharacterized protein FTOL_13379 [Fusarium torulosum]